VLKYLIPGSQPQTVTFQFVDPQLTMTPMPPAVNSDVPLSSVSDIASTSSMQPVAVSTSATTFPTTVPTTVAMELNGSNATPSTVTSDMVVSLSAQSLSWLLYLLVAVVALGAFVVLVACVLAQRKKQKRRSVAMSALYGDQEQGAAVVGDMKSARAESLTASLARRPPNYGDISVALQPSNYVAVSLPSQDYGDLHLRTQSTPYDKSDLPQFAE